tara:strand:- start:219 stop:698 length:480 start_codon:yes stop_codon:yes gene_type:complete
MAGFNPFAPQMRQQQQPQMQGVPTPNVAMHDKPSFMETVAPTVLEKAMSSDMAGAGADYVQDSASNAWGSLTGAGGPSAAALADAAVVTSQAPTALMGAGMGGGAGLVGAEAAIASQAATAAATTAAGTAAGAAPLALMAGPFAPLVLGGMMVAANSGK